jgi:hypothetical protein
MGKENLEKIGYIKIHRCLLDNPISKKPNYAWLWIVLLLKANHKPNKFMWNNEIIIIREGQLITGRKQLAIETGISESSVDRILNFFENEHQIEQQKTNKFRLITVINWKDYQQNNIKTNNKRTTNEQQVDTNKNDKNDKKIKLSNESVPYKTLKEYRKLRRAQAGRAPITSPKPTEKQKAFLKRMKSLDYFHKVGVEKGFDYLQEEDEQANKKFIGISRAYEKRFKEDWKEPINWWFNEDNAWCDYHPSNFFSIGTWLKFENRGNKITKKEPWQGVFRISNEELKRMGGVKV